MDFIGCFVDVIVVGVDSGVGGGVVCEFDSFRVHLGGVLLMER
jgi:hypothetical protein